jgi:uroporphyrinogen decarboxylase
LMAEPTAGLLSPAGLAEFSSPYVRHIREAVEVGGFSVILHNCGARLAHLDALLESGARALHFGAPMDLAAARAQAPEDVILCGNLDPAAVFVGLPPAAVADVTRALVASLGRHDNVVFSSGCDIPPSVSVETLAAFCEAVASFPTGQTR